MEMIFSVSWNVEMLNAFETIFPLLETPSGHQKGGFFWLCVMQRLWSSRSLMFLVLQS